MFFIVLSFVIEAKVQIFGIRPAMTALLVYSIGLRNGPLKGLAFGASIGIISDSLSGGMLGPNLLGKGMAGYLSATFTGILFFRWTPLVGILGVAAITFLDRAVSFVSISIFEQMPSGIPYALYVMLGQAGLNSIAGLFIKPKNNV